MTCPSTGAVTSTDTYAVGVSVKAKSTVSNVGDGERFVFIQAVDVAGVGGDVVSSQRSRRSPVDTSGFVLKRFANSWRLALV